MHVIMNLLKISKTSIPKKKKKKKKNLSPNLPMCLIETYR